MKNLRITYENGKKVTLKDVTKIELDEPKKPKILIRFFDDKGKNESHYINGDIFIEVESVLEDFIDKDNFKKIEIIKQ